MNTPFLHIFKEYRFDGADAPRMQALRALAEKISVSSLEGDRARQVITAHCQADALAEPALLQALEVEIAASYSLQRFQIRLRYPAALLDDAYLHTLLARIKAKHPAANGFLDDAVFLSDLDAGCLQIRLRNGGLQFLQNAGFDKSLERTIYDEFGLRLRVEFTGVTELDADTAAAQLETLPVRPSAAPEPSYAAVPVPKPASRSRGGAAGGVRKSSLRLADGEELIYGKPLAEERLPIAQLDLNMLSTTVKGEIFSVNHRFLEARNLQIVSFDITDYESSIRISRAMEPERAAPLVDKLRAGDWVLVQGQPVYNNFEGELTLNPKAVVRIPVSRRRDTAPEKRIELHLHTNMSAMDATASPEALVRRAHEWGHKAVAITDHGVAQAFPEAADTAKKLGIQILYGVEGYDFNDRPETMAVFGPQDAGFDGDFVVFDLETTGLSAAEDGITEIAAVLVENGVPGREFHAMVNPRRPIPLRVTELTGITDAMVAGAPGIEAVLPEFLDFIGDRVLAAHNAAFDMGFLQAACAASGIKRDFTYLDTLEIARALLPQLPRHRLNDLAQHLEAGDFRHHRAGDDAAVLARIMLRLFEQLAAQGVTRLSEVNDCVWRLSAGREQKLGDYAHIIILAKNRTGLRNLYELISLSHLKYFKRRPLIPRSELIRLREGLLIGSACEAGTLFTALLRGRPWAELKRMAKFFDFLEVQPVANNAFLVREGKVKDDNALRRLNESIVRLGEAVGRPVVATGDVHFLDPQDEIFRRILMAGQGFSDADCQPPLYFKTTDEMLEEFSYLGAAKARELVIENPVKIAALCEPLRPVPEGVYPPSLPGSAEELENLARRRAGELYGDPLPPLIRERLEAELEPIIRNGYDVMYMIAQKLVRQSQEAGYLVGSRGSVGSSIVAYFAGITEVNALPPHYRCPACFYCEFPDDPGVGSGVDLPGKNCPVCGTPCQKDGHDILFATFLGFNAEKQPDIDLNFSGEYQAQTHRNTIALFGEGQVFRAGTIGTIAEKTAFGFVKKYMEERSRAVSKAELNRLTLGCTGVKRTTGQHPGGLIIVPGDRSIYEFCPVQHPADDTKSDIITTHFDFHSIHDNLLKLDLLGHDDPTMIRMLEELTGLNATRDIPLDDPETMSLFRSSRALGFENDELLGPTGAAALPEFGTKFVREMLCDTTPSTFAGLVRISGLSHGTDVWLGNAQALIREGVADLSGIICCRDDITSFLMQKGITPKLSLTISEAVRKGKKLTPDWEAEMLAHGVPDWYIKSCNKIQYLFPRAHAVAYVLMALRIAWCKVHRPLAFYAAYFTIRANAFDAATAVAGLSAVRTKYLEITGRIARGDPVTAVEKDAMGTLEICYEFYRRGFSFAGVDVYRSHVDHFSIEENSLRLPFTAVGGLGLQAAQDIVSEREKTPFSSVDELNLRCPKVTKTVLALLEEYGAFAGLPKSDQLTLFD